MENQVVSISVNEQTLTEITEANNTEASDLSTTVGKLQINTNEECSNSAKFLQQIKSISRSMEATRISLTKPLDECKKRIMDVFREPQNTLKESETMLKGAMVKFQTEQEKIQREQEERARLKALAEENRKRNALEERAKKEAEKGNVEKSEMLSEKAENVYVPPVIHTPKLEKIAGISTRKDWKHRVTDKKKVPEKYKVINDKMLAAMAKASQGTIEVPGVEFYQETVMSARQAGG